MMRAGERWKGCFFQIRKDSTPFKRYLFFRIIEKNRFLYRAYLLASRCKNKVFTAWGCAGLYAFFYAGLSFPRERRAVSMVRLNTEKKTLFLFFEDGPVSIGLIRQTCRVSGSALMDLISAVSLKNIKRDIRVIRTLLHRHDLFVVLRGLQYLAYYDPCIKELRPEETEKIFFFTDANPHGRALMHSARSKQIYSCFISHGEPNPPFVPLCSDAAYLLGKRSWDRYRRCGSRVGTVLFQGHKERWAPVRPLDSVRGIRAGIFLSKSTPAEGVLSLIERIRTSLGCDAILVRPHPNMGSSTALQKSLTRLPDVRISEGRGVDEDIRACDVVFAGDTTVHLEVLLGGRPSLYVRGLERVFFDRYGYVEEGLIMEWREASSAADINGFYAGKKKTAVIHYHCNIEKSLAQTNRELYGVLSE